jgi:hypothetical protein
LTAQDGKQRTLIYAGQTVLAWQSVASNGSQSVAWEHRDASGASLRMTDAAGQVTGQSAEMDPMGANAGLFKPLTGNAPKKMGQLAPYPGIVDMLTNGGCTLDGVEFNCGRAWEMSGKDAANPDPNRTSPGTAGSAGAMPIYGKFCVTTSGGGITKTTCTMEVTGYTSALSLGSSITPQNSGGGGGTGPGALNTGPKATFNRAKFDQCLNKYFPGLTAFPGIMGLNFDRATGGSFAGAKGSQPFAVSTRSNGFTASNLGSMLKQIGVGNGGSNSGATFNYNPKYNFVASDVASDSTYKDIGVFGVFIHEVADSLGDQYPLKDPYGGYAKQNAAHGIGDPDVGAAFETCVFGGLVGLQTGRVGSRRELR